MSCADALQAVNEVCGDLEAHGEDRPRFADIVGQVAVQFAVELMCVYFRATFKKVSASRRRARQST